MEFTMKFNMDNAAFEHGKARETARILRSIAEIVVQGIDGKAIMDINGNKIGEWEIK